MEEAIVHLERTVTIRIEERHDAGSNRQASPLNPRQWYMAFVKWWGAFACETP